MVKYGPMTTTLFSGPLSMFGAKAQIAALEKGIGFELVMVPFDKNDAYLPKQCRPAPSHLQRHVVA